MSKRRKQTHPDMTNLDLEVRIPTEVMKDKDKFARLVARVRELAQSEYPLWDQDRALPARFVQFPFDGDTYTAVYLFADGKGCLLWGAHADRLRVQFPVHFHAVGHGNGYRFTSTLRGEGSSVDLTPDEFGAMVESLRAALSRLTRLRAEGRFLEPEVVAVKALCMTIDAHNLGKLARLVDYLGMVLGDGK